MYYFKVEIVPIKLSSDKPWAKLRMSRKQYEAARMWKEQRARSLEWKGVAPRV